MSKPLPYLTDETRHDIRNSRDKLYLFVPTPQIRQAFAFIVAVLSQRYRVGVVSYALMCSHIHILVVDLSDEDEPSDVPAFRSVLRSVFAQFVKCYWERDNGKIFCPDSVGQSIKVVDVPSITRAITYIETNPMRAGLERSPKMMKCAVSQREWLLEPLRVERPDLYFQKRTWPDVAELKLVVPPDARKAGHDEESFYRLSNTDLEKEIRRVWRGRKRAKLPSKPLHVIERMRPEHGGGQSSADHSEVLVSCDDPDRKKLETERIRAFRREHALAMKNLREEVEDVQFPPGTYKAVRIYGVRVRRPAQEDPNQRLE